MKHVNPIQDELLEIFEEILEDLVQANKRFEDLSLEDIDEGGIS